MLVHFVQLRAEHELRAAFHTMGAVSPSTARPGKDLVVDKTAFDNLLRRGVIREGAPGTFYLYEPQPVTRQLALKLLGGIALILLVVGILYCP